MNDSHQCLSPLLDSSIYVERAVDNAIESANQQLGAKCGKLICERGWHIQIEDVGEFSGLSSALLQEILNWALAESLEARLEIGSQIGNC